MVTLFWLALLGAWMVLFVTKRWGLELDPGSVFFVQAAKHLVSGQGLSLFSSSGTLQPMTGQLPLFPFVLSWGWFLGLDPFTWARFLNAGLFGASIFLAGMLAFACVRRMSSAVIAAILLLSSVHVFQAHLELSSEALFLAGALGCFLALSFFQRSGTRRSFYAAALLAAAAGVVRESGLLLIASGAAALFVLSPGGREARFRRAFFFTALAFIPLWLSLLWRMANGAQAFSLAQGFHWPGLAQVYGFINALSSRLLPGAAPDAVRWAVLGLVCGVLLVMVRRIKIDLGSWQARAMFAPACFIGLFLAAAFIRMFAAAGVGRCSSLAVWAVLLVLLASGWPALWRQEWLHRRFKQAIVVCLVAFVALNMVRSVQLGRLFSRQGAGYGAKAWVTSQVVKNIRALDEVPVYTNDPLAFYYLTGRPAAIFAVGCGCGDGGICGDKGPFPLVAQMIDDLQQRRALVVIFAGSKKGKDLLARISRDAPLERFMGDGVADIYGLKRKR
jgi:hypothetical protein